jgi:hypothetical protein
MPHSATTSVSGDDMNTTISWNWGARFIHPTTGPAGGQALGKKDKLWVGPGILSITGCHRRLVDILLFQNGEPAVMYRQREWNAAPACPCIQQ